MNITLPKQTESIEQLPVQETEPMNDDTSLEPVQSIAEKKLSIADITKGELGEVIKRIAKNKPDLVTKANNIPHIKRLPFGMFELDYATRGGIPYNRITMFWGIESSGKSTKTYLLIRMSQKLYPRKFQAYIDAESTFDPSWAEAYGVDLDRLLVIRPESGEQASEVLEAMIKTLEIDLIVVDSLPALLPMREMERDMETAEVGGNALLVRRMTTKTVAFLATEQLRGHDVAVVFINQVRLKIGQLHGNPETMPCGQAPKFYSSLIIKFYAKDVVDKSIHPEKPAYRDTIATITKSKVLINSKKTDYKIAMIDNGVQGLGETDSFNAVNGYLKNFGFVEKVKEGYALYEDGLDQEPTIYEKVGDIKDLYQTDKMFANKLHSLVANFDGVKATYVGS